MSTNTSTSSPRSFFSKIRTKSQILLNGKKNKPQCPPVPDNGSQTLYLRLNRRFLLQFPDATEDKPNPQPLPPPPGTAGNLIVINASLSDLRPFAGDTVDWLIKVAKLIFEPLGTSSLYTFTTESPEWWLEREMEPSTWRIVAQGEQLRATIYEFRPDNDALVMLTQKSERHMRSVTTNTSSDRAASFRDALLRRDRLCIISQQDRSMIASHLIPRRLGDNGVQAIIQRFAGSSTSLNRFDPTIGVFLFTGLDMCVDAYNLGFWNIGPVGLYVLYSILLIFVCWDGRTDMLSTIFLTSLQVFMDKRSTPMRQMYMAARSPSLHMTPPCPSHWLVHLTGTTSSVSSKNSPPLHIKTSRTYPISPYHSAQERMMMRVTLNLMMNGTLQILLTLLISGILLSGGCLSTWRQRNAIMPLQHGALESLLVKVCKLFYLDFLLLFTWTGCIKCFHFELNHNAVDFHY